MENDHVGPVYTKGFVFIASSIVFSASCARGLNGWHLLRWMLDGVSERAESKYKCFFLKFLACRFEKQGSFQTLVL